MNNRYYLGVVKHLLITHGYWEPWALETMFEWDYYPEPQDDLFFWEQCRLNHII